MSNQRSRVSRSSSTSSYTNTPKSPFTPCQSYISLASILGSINYERQAVRMVASGIVTPVELPTPAIGRASRLSISSKRFSLRPVSLSLSRSPNKHFSSAKHIPTDDLSAGPVLHILVSSAPWWHKFFGKRTTSSDFTESLQNLHHWLQAQPDHDLGSAERVLLEFQKFPINPETLQAVLLEQIVWVQRRNILSLRAANAAKLYTYALKAITDSTIAVCWEVVCEEHEAAMMAKPASQIKRITPDPSLTLPDDAVCQVVEGYSALVDCTRAEDQFKRVIDSVDWFGRTVKTLYSSLIGVAPVIFEPNIRGGVETELQRALETTGGLKTFNQALASYDLEPVTIDKNFLKELRRRRLFLEKCRNGLVELLTNSISVLGNMVPLSPNTTTPSSFTTSAAVSSGAAPPTSHRHSYHSINPSEGDSDEDPNLDPAKIPLSFFPNWWSDFNLYPMNRQSQYRAYTFSIQRANMTRRVESDRLQSLGQQPLAALPIQTEEQWFSSTREKMIKQAKKKYKVAMKNNNNDGGVAVGEPNETQQKGGSSDNLRPAVNALQTQRGIPASQLPPALTTNGSPSSVITIPHFLNSYLDKSRQGMIPVLHTNTPQLITMTREEFGLLYQRCVRLREGCTTTVENCSQAISKLATLERVLTR